MFYKGRATSWGFKQKWMKSYKRIHHPTIFVWGQIIQGRFIAPPYGQIYQRTNLLSTIYTRYSHLTKTKIKNYKFPQYIWNWQEEPYLFAAMTISQLVQTKQLPATQRKERLGEKAECLSLSLFFADGGGGGGANTNDSKKAWQSLLQPVDEEGVSILVDAAILLPVVPLLLNRGPSDRNQTYM